MKNAHLACFRPFLLVYLLACLLIIGACKKHDLKKIAGFKWNPGLATPIGFATFDSYDILAAQDSSDLFVINPINGEIALVYDGEIASVTASSIFQLGDHTESFSYSASGMGVSATPAFAGSVTIPLDEDVQFPGPNGAELHSVTFEGGNLQISVQSNFHHDITLTMTFPDLTLGGMPIVRTLDLDYQGTVPQNAAETIDLSDVFADFTAGGTDVNRLRVNIDATITGSGEGISGTESVSVQLQVNDPQFRNMRGYFGQHTVTQVSDSIHIKLFDKNYTTGTFQLTNPHIRFLIDNSFGMPMDLYFNEVKTVNTINGTEHELTGFPTPLGLNYPTVMGESASTTLLLNTSNTNNLDAIITPTPKFLLYDISAVSNPDGPPPTLNFIEAGSRLVVRGELTLPLEGFAYGLTFADTLPFKLNQDVSNIEEALFRVNAANSFPVSFNAQAVFVDANYVPLFTLLHVGDQVITAAPVDGSGKVTASANKITDVFVDQEQIRLMGMAKHVIIAGTAATTDPQGTVVKFFDSYKLSIKLGMQVKINSAL